MYQRWVFTLDGERFPLELVRELVGYLHEHQQHYVVMGLEKEKINVEGTMLTDLQYVSLFSAIKPQPKHTVRCHFVLASIPSTSCAS